jgi:hypothetical protein
MAACTSSRLLWLQGIVLGTAAVAVASPPAVGTAMLVPLTRTAAARLAANAVSGDARLVGTGPLPGSLVVAGTRAKLRAALGPGVLILAAPPSGCGA